MTLTRRERLREATIEEIKYIARQQMAEQGAANISLRGIARQMGVSAPALYRYFASYDDLITVLIADAYTSLGEAMARARERAPADQFALQVQAIAHAYHEWALQYAQDYLLIYGTPIPGYDAPVEVTGPPARRIWSIFIEVLGEAQRAGQLSLPDKLLGSSSRYAQMQARVQNTLDLEVTAPLLHQALTLWTQLHGLIMAEITNRFRLLSSDPFFIEVNYMIERLGLQLPRPNS